MITINVINNITIAELLDINNNSASYSAGQNIVLSDFYDESEIVAAASLQTAITAGDVDFLINGTQSNSLNDLLKSSIGSIDQNSDVDTSTNSPSTRHKLSWNGSNWVPIQTDILNEVTVGKDGDVDFNTIESAINWINTQSPSPSNPFALSVSPGIYNENPLVLPEWVILIGSGPRTRISAIDVDSDLLTIGNNSSIRSISLQGVTNASNYLVRSTATVGGLGSIVDLFLTSATNGLIVTAGSGLQRLTVSQILSAGLTGVILTAAVNSRLTIQGASFIGDAIGTVGLRQEDNASIVGFNIRADTCNIGLQTNGTGEIELSNFIADSSNIPVDQQSQTTIRLFGGFFDIRNSSFTNEELVEGFFQNKLDGDQTEFKIFSELGVGTPVGGKESAFGEGNSTSEFLVLYTENAAGTIQVDETQNARFEDDNTVSFQNNAVGEKIYIGNRAIDGNSGLSVMWFGIRQTLDQLITENDKIVDLEYWNGSSWVSTTYMGTERNAPFFPLAQNIYAGNVEQVRFNSFMSVDWVRNDPFSLGVNYYWVRLVLNQTVTQLPVWDLIKLHTNRLEINQNGFEEFFGTARPIGRLAFDVNLFTAANASPGNQDVYLSDVLGVGRVENEFQAGATDRSALNTYLPFDIDTSCPINLRITYVTDDNTGGNIHWTVRWALSSDNDSVFQTAAQAPPSAPDEKEIILIDPVPAQFTQKTIEFNLDISDALSRRNGSFGDILWISIERAAGDVQDTHLGDVSLINLVPFYTKWCDGGHQ